ncbi:hypothetical protein LCGC14_1105590, partial [marine sediment metagenome]
YIEGVLEVDGVVNLDGSIDADVTTAAITATAADLTAIVLVTSNAAGGIDIDTGTGGIDVDLDATGSFAIDGDLFAIGSDGADGGVADGDNDLYVVGDVEVDGVLDVAGRTMLLAQYSADPNAASFAVTVTGLDADDYLIATVNLPTNGAYLKSAEAAIDKATVTLSADPAASVTVTIMAWAD